MAEHQGTPGTHNTPLRHTLPGMLAQHAKDTPNQVALREKHRGIWREITWKTYFEQVQATAHQLAKLGIAQGDHVGILSDNRPEWLYADLAAQGLGARSVGIYQTNPPADLKYVLNHSQCKVLFCEDQEQVDKAIEIADETPGVQKIIVFDKRGTRDYDDPRLVPWEEFWAEGQRAAQNDNNWFEEQLRQRQADAPCMVVYTSGTTGEPKGALLSSRNATSLASNALKHLNIHSGDYLLSYLPLCHVAEKIFSVFLPLDAGCIVHFGESIATVQSDLKEVSPTVFLGVPRIWEKMHASVTLRMQNASWLKRQLYCFFRDAGAKYSQKRQQGTASPLDTLIMALGDLLVFRALQEHLGLRRCRLPVSGAAPISPQLLSFFHGVGVPVIEGYGQTECAGVSHSNQQPVPFFGSVGRPIPGMQCKLAEDGEILLKGPTIFVGYLHNDEATKGTINDDGWLKTGDLGQIDPEGYLRITGRKKEIIITSGGKNLSPEKIENTLKMSPFIKEAIAIGDARKFISALIQVDYDAAGDWATRQKITYTSYNDLVSKEQVRDLIKQEVHKSDSSLAKVENVRAFRLLPKELHQDDGELTATQKVRRRNVLKAYAPLIDEMYRG